MTHNADYVSPPTYGAKCHLCGCVDHRGPRSAAPISWLEMPGRCRTCSTCQGNALMVVISEAGLDFFNPQVREAVRAVHEGRAHPLLDRLRVECNALGSIVEVAGERWSVADAQFDDGDVGAHLHLTLVRQPPPDLDGTGAGS